MYTHALGLHELRAALFTDKARLALRSVEASVDLARRGRSDDGFIGDPFEQRVARMVRHAPVESAVVDAFADAADAQGVVTHDKVVDVLGDKGAAFFEVLAAVH